MKKVIHHDIYIGSVMLLISLFMYLKTLPMPSTTAAFPKLMIFILTAFSIWIVFKGVQKTKAINNGKESASNLITLAMTKMPLFFFLIVVIYVVLIEFLGFFASTSIFIVAFMYFYNIRDLKKIVLTIIGVDAFVYLLFITQLNVPLPRGILF